MSVTRRVKSVLLIPLLLLGADALAALPRSGLSVSAQQFATEPNWNSRVDLTAKWESETKPEEQYRPSRELWFDSFFESSRAGDRSFEFDIAVMRLSTGGFGHIWFGRTHPWLEDGRGRRRAMPNPTGAVGVNWGQNQGRALEPRVLGWIGAGYSGTTSGGISLTGLMSPIYLPSFGPRVDFSETSATEGSRFAKLPPAYLLHNQRLIPVRYRIQTGDLAKIVLQNQVYLSLGVDRDDFGVRVFAWSAPTPSPEIEATGKLRVDSDLDELNAVVTATPSFPRQTNVGIQWELGTRRISDVQAVYQKESGRLTLSAELRPFRWLRGGVLHSIDTRPAPVAADSPVPAAQPYAEKLFWSEFKVGFFGYRLQSKLRFEQHLVSEREGLWVQPEVRYAPDGRLGVFAMASLIAGKNGSYFGQWRSLDSVGTGVSYQW